MSESMPGVDHPPQSSVTRPAYQGRWRIGAALFLIACVAQGILWARWWDDPTHFKMSVLFVWPAALFLLLIWWTFFSGWSAGIRYGTVAGIVVGLVAFFALFRLDRFDGDMVPTRVVPRWAASKSDEARQFLKEAATAPTPAPAPREELLEATPGDWPGFRGPAHDGIVGGAPLRTDWGTRAPKVLWKHPVGRGWSSFAVIGDLAFTQEQRDGVGECVVAYSVNDGRQVWIHQDPVQFTVVEAQGGNGPRATPQFDRGHLFTLGGTGLLNCLNAATGLSVWSVNILEDNPGGPPRQNLPWGMAGSPLVTDDLVIVIPGGTPAVVAYDRQTGKRVWGSGDGDASYAGAVAGTLQGEPVILAPLGTGLALHARNDGTRLAQFDWSNAPKVCGMLPVVLDNSSVLFGIGYGIGTVRLDVTRQGADWTMAPRWQTTRLKPKFNDLVLRDGHIYGLDDGTLTCVNQETGKTLWKSGRYGYGQLLLFGDVLLILSEQGELVLVPAQPERPAELARFQALDPEGITWNHPAWSRGRLLIRNGLEAACLDLE